jgi:23S rRNA (guanosine2251-2'-O)-methyltransferase
MADEQTILEGFVSIQAALQAQSRPIHAIYLRQHKLDQDSGRLERLAREHNIPIERISAERIDELTSGKSHGGIAALAGPRHTVPLDTLLTPHAPRASLHALRSTPPFIVMLDGIEDPFNFGYAVRALYAAGVDGLVVQPRNWLSAAGVVARASAGASERIPTAIADSAQVAADFFRGHGLTIACAAKEKRAVSLYDSNLAIPLFLVAGGEKRGITRSFIDTADLLLQIHYGRPFDQSLGTAAATAVLAFEIMRQRKKIEPQNTPRTRREEKPKIPSHGQKRSRTKE